MRNMIRLRIDVDYPYPSRWQSFLYTMLTIWRAKDYLKNAKIIARMINDSLECIKATWFFTPKTIPDRELLEKLDKGKHEVALHIANKPLEEMKLLEKATGRTIKYYTIHGTARLLGRLIWKRWKTAEPKIPKNFPLQSFYQFPTLGLDSLCYENDTAKAVRIAKKNIIKGNILHIHPEWLFQKGTINHRGPFYETFRRILKVDKEIETITVRKKIFFKVASNPNEHLEDIIPTDEFIQKLDERGIDVFTFIERKWCNTILNPPHFWLKAEDNTALLQVAAYDEWWKKVGKKTRNMVRKARKKGLITEIVEPNEELTVGIWKIYNETPTRQERAFPHYGIPLQTVARSVLSAQNCTFIVAFFQDELAGFAKLVHGDNIAVISQILSSLKHLDKAVNNALIARTIEFCANKKINWIIYGRIGNHPSLDKFKFSNGFARFPLIRYYIPITRKGRIAIKMGLHREIKDAIPQSIKYPLIPLYNWVSRKRMQIKQLLI